MTAHEALVIGRNRLTREGWTKGVLHGKDGYCALGAIDMHGGAHSALRGAMGVHWVALWNNDPKRTLEEVLEAFDRAIAMTAPMPTDPFPEGDALVPQAETLDGHSDERALIRVP